MLGRPCIDPALVQFKIMHVNGGRVRFIHFVLTVAAILFGCALSAPAHADTTIIIVRHGEKAARGLGQLSCQGLNRSLALPSVLLSRYGKPAVIYAPDPAIKKMDKGEPYAYIRPLATIEPLAVNVGLPVDVDWGMADTNHLAEALLAGLEGVQVVAWEHYFAEKLAETLLAAAGGNPAEVPVWKDSDYDSIYVVRIAGRGKDRHASFAHDYEGLNGLPEKCGG